MEKLRNEIEKMWFANIPGFNEMNIKMVDYDREARIDEDINDLREKLFKQVDSIPTEILATLAVDFYEPEHIKELSADIEQYFESMAIYADVNYSYDDKKFSISFDNGCINNESTKTIDIKLFDVVNHKLIYRVSTLQALKGCLIESLVVPLRKE